MAVVDKKISELTALTDATAGDLLVIVDIDEPDPDDQTKRITWAELMGTPGPIGVTTPSTGEFTELTLVNTVNEISNDETLSGDSTSAISTEHAIKTYVDTLVTSTAIVGNETLSNGDTTATITFVSSQPDTDYGVAWSLVNTTDNFPSIYAGTIFEKTTDGFLVIFSGSMDTNNYVLSWIVTR